MSTVFVGLLFAVLAVASDGRPIEVVQKRDQKSGLALIKSVADVNAGRPDGSTPLAWAVNREDAEIAGAPLAEGARVNAADENGDTPLMLAVNSANLELVKLLLNHRAEVGQTRPTIELLRKLTAENKPQ